MVLFGLPLEPCDPVVVAMVFFNVLNRHFFGTLNQLFLCVCSSKQVPSPTNQGCSSICGGRAIESRVFGLDSLYIHLPT